jgi:hypothetical protein
LTDEQMPLAKSVVSRVPGLTEFAVAELGKPGENTPEQQRRIMALAGIA